MSVLLTKLLLVGYSWTYLLDLRDPQEEQIWRHLLFNSSVRRLHNTEETRLKSFTLVSDSFWAPTDLYPV